MIRRTMSWWRSGAHAPGITRGALHSFIFVTILVLVLSAINVLYTAHETSQETAGSRARERQIEHNTALVAQQARRNQQTDQALCAAIIAIEPAVSARIAHQLKLALGRDGCPAAAGR